MWKDIETAPKDGRCILLGAWRTARSHKTSRNWHCYLGKWHSRYREWLVFPGGVVFWPTHWMPEPEPPWDINDAS